MTTTPIVRRTAAAVATITLATQGASAQVAEWRSSARTDSTSAASGPTDSTSTTSASTDSTSTSRNPTDATTEPTSAPPPQQEVPPVWPPPSREEPATAPPARTDASRISPLPSDKGTAGAAPPAPTSALPASPSPSRNRPDPWRWLLVEAQLGLGAPLGYLGLSVNAAPVPWLALDLGAGLGASGVQYAAASRVRIARWGSLDRYAFYLGAGVSIGPYDDNVSVAIPADGAAASTDTTHYHWTTAYWGNLEAGLEIRTESGFSARPFVGAGYLFNVNAGSAVLSPGSGPPDGMSPWQPYIGVGLGYAFKAW